MYNITPILNSLFSTQKATFATISWIIKTIIQIKNTHKQQLGYGSKTIGN